MSKVLSDYAYYASEKIECSSLTTETYVGMDNLIPNRGGVTISEYVPSEGTTTAYKRGDILLGNIRPYFKKIWLAENDGGCSPDVLCIHCKEGVSPLFIYAVLAQDSFFDYDVAGAKGSKMPRGDKDHIMAFPVPDLDDADAIGELIDNLYKKIQNNSAICSTLESMSKLLYDYWFVQFDFPDENGRPYKSSGGKMVWNEELKREIPEGWEVKRLREVATYVSDKVASALLTKNTYVGTDNLLSDMKGKTVSEYVPAEGYSTAYKEKDILIANIRPYFKKIWQSDSIGGASADVLVIRTEKEIDSWVYSTLARDDFFAYDMAGSKGSKMPRGDKDHIMNYPIPYSEQIIKQFSFKTSYVNELRNYYYHENQQLASLRDFLLPMLMNRQVKVGKAGE